MSVTNSDGIKKVWRLVTPMAKSGFIISPAMLSSNDLEQFATAIEEGTISTLPHAEKIRFLPNPLHKTHYEKEARITIEDIRLHSPVKAGD